MNFCYYKIGLAMVLLLTLSQLSAREQGDSITTLKEVVVTESYQQSKARTTSPLQVLSAADIEGLNVLQLSDAVKHFSGVTVKDYGGIGGLKTISVRSLGANHTAISYDGITLTDVQSGQIDIGRFSLDNVDRVSLSTGQSDQIFQPARLLASASVLDIKTQQPIFRDNSPFQGMVSLKMGSLTLLNPSTNLHYRITKHTTLSTSAEWLSADGQYPYLLHYGFVGIDSTSTEHRKNTDVKNLRLEGTLHSQPSDKTQATLKSYYYTSQRGLPGATIYYNTLNFSSQRIEDYTFFVQGKVEHRFSDKWSLQANGKFNTGFLHYIDPTYLNQEGKTENNYLQKEYYGSVATAWRPTRPLSIVFSNDYWLNTLDADLYQFAYPTRQTWLSAIATKYATAHITAIASLLRTQTFEETKRGKKAQPQQKLSPYISISLKPFNTLDWRMRLFYKNIFRLPTFNDLYYTRIGNPNLLPEDTDQFNIGTTFSAKIGRWLPLLVFTADAYHNRVKNKIVAYPTKNIFEWTMLNYGKVHITGLDLNLNTTLRLTQNYHLTTGTTYTYQKALNRTDREGRDYGHQIAYTPRTSGSGNVILKNPYIDIAYAMLWSGHRYAVNQNYAENRVAGYTDHSISLRKEVKTTIGVININVEALNLLNQNYEVIRFFPMPGRTIRGTVILTIN